MIKLLNWIIETFYPDKMFYGKKCNPFTMFVNAVEKRNDAVMVGAMFLANYVADNNSNEGQFTVYGVEKSGVKRGDWIVTVKRVENTDEDINENPN